jgi:hypothetical protein
MQANGIDGRLPITDMINISLLSSVAQLREKNSFCVLRWIQNKAEICLYNSGNVIIYS